MIGIQNRCFTLVALSVALGLGNATCGQSISGPPPGQVGDLIANTNGGAIAIFVSGPDITDHCVSPFCNQDSQTGADGLTYVTILGYSALQNQWLFFTPVGGFEGVDVVDGVLASGVSSEDVCGVEWLMAYGSPTGLPDTSGVVFCIPEPATEMLNLLGVAALGFIRRREAQDHLTMSYSA